MVKKAFLIFVIMCIITIFVYPVHIVQASDSFMSGADNFLNLGKTDYENAIDTTNLKNASDLIYNTLLVVGIVIAVIMGAVLGIQFIMGSVEQKVKVKESIIPFVVGCIVIFGAFGIWRLVILLIR